MAEAVNELADFYRFVGNQLGSGGVDISPEEALAQWRSARPLPEELRESVAAIERALKQAKEGQGVSLEDFDHRFRQRHNIRRV
ncbi:MAG: hypothetical protein KY475_00140 [Planctomycetes bacterium]|nr:hypothetical protein [Planctomycetota bacterium]